MTRFATLALALLLAAPALAQTPTVTVSADITSNTTWSASQVYLLDGLIYVRPGATLTIEPGTIIKGREVPSSATGDLASGLVIMIDANIEANGRADAPIVMTAEADDVSDPSDLGPDDRSLWGGLLVFGRATTNSTPAITNVEGIPASDDTRFGCDDVTFMCDDDDDSGTIRYVSVRHGGFGFEPGSEINGMTFGAVGRGTTIEYVEVYANSDDAFEFFGGTTQAKYLVGAFNGDDTFDTDRGFRGKFQYGFSINNPGNDAGRCFENDGGVSSLGGEDATPYARPIYSNITCIGAGIGADGSQLGEDSNSAAMQLRDNTGGAVYNSIFTDYPGSALNIEALSSGEDSENRFGTNSEGDDLVIRNNLFFGFGAGSTAADLVDNDSDNSAGRQAEIESAFGAANTIANPQLATIGRASGSNLDPRPLASGPAASGAEFTGNALAGDAFFEVVDFLGAFEPTASAADNSNPTWLGGWTALSQTGVLSGQATPAETGPAGDRIGLEAFPNPVRGAGTVRFALDRAQTVRLALYDALGRQVAVVAEGAFAAGAATAALPTAGLAPGVYVLRLAGETVAVSQTVSVVR